MPKALIALMLMLWAQFAAAQVATTPQSWQADLQTLTTQLPTLHPNLFFQTPRSTFEQAAASLNQQIPGLSDWQIIARMGELVASVGDAHTNLILTQAAAAFRTLPIRVQWFDDGLFVTASLPGAERAIGKRITRIGAMDIQEAYSRVLPFISAENDAWRLKMSQDYLVVPEILAAAGIISSNDAAEFEFQDSTSGRFALNLAAYRTTDARTWIYVPDLTGAAVPLYRKQNNLNYWYQYLTDSRTMYFKYNSCNNAANLSFATFTAEFLAVVDAYPIDRFVFDFRNNGGGDSSIIQPLIAGLEQRYLAGQFVTARLYVVVGRDTISSSLLNALQLKEAPVTTIVGEPTGGRPNHYGNIRSLTLPNSGLRISHSTRFYSSPVTTESLNPDVRVALPASAFFQNRDPVLEAVLETPAPMTTAAPFVMYNAGGTRLQTGGTGSNLAVGYATVAAAAETPFGFGVIQYRQGNILVSEATVASSTPIASGITYVEVDGRVNTGVAIANSSTSDASVEFTVTNENGQIIKTGMLDVPAGRQIARFLSEGPFNVQSLSAGTLRMTSSVPVSMLALRGYSNERNEFLLSTLAVREPASVISPIYCAHFADGEGWTTQINLVNPSGTTISGTFEFVPGERFTYTLAPYSARRFRTSGAGGVRTGFVRVIPDAGSIVASTTALFSYHRDAITVTEASVHGLPAKTSHALIVAGSGGFSVQAANAVMSGIGVANPSATPAMVQVSLVSLAGSVSSSTMVEIPANGQRALFIDQLFAGNVTQPFEGTLRLTSSGEIGVTGLRGQYNQRGDFLISATPVFDVTSGNVFTHFADGAGYSTRFVFIARSSPGGVLRFFAPDGSSLALDVR